MTELYRLDGVGSQDAAWRAGDDGLGVLLKARGIN
jgi:hypothetical protein